MVVWYGLTMFLSAGLLFLVQPMVARMILPLLGGTPAVWNGCMLFFQALLLAGYAYADLAPRFLGVRRQAFVHLLVISLPLFFLPIHIVGKAPPSTSDNPVPWLLLTLTMAAGLPFFALATGAPLLQRWFASTTHHASGDPYFFYAASNLGSMLALLSYPFIIEPWLPLAEQTRIWSLAYGVLVLLIGGCAAFLSRSAPDAPAALATAAATPLSIARRVRWVALAFVPSSLMLGVTTYLTTDISPIPLLWVIPLSLYLLTFSLAFSRLPRIFYQVAAVILPGLIAALIVARIERFPFFGPSFAFQLTKPQLIILHLATFFVAAFVCHGELAGLRPSTSRLTEYYLWISLGGMLGGLFNSVIAPLVFDRLVEYPLLFAAVCLLRPHFGHQVTGDTAGPGADGLPSRLPWSRAITVAWLTYGGVAACLFIAPTLGHGDWSRSRRIRNFFGPLLAIHSDATGMSVLSHGTTMHGAQVLSNAYTRREPLSYFSRESGIGKVFAALSRNPPRNVGVVGLGAGTIACYAVPGQHWIFYEINPAVPRIARDQKYFTYVDDAQRRGVDVQIILGDARLKIDSEAALHDLLILDAFNSDAVPIHLLTREAIRIYLARLSPHGMMAFHVTNHFVDLSSVLASLARNLGLICLLYEDYPDDPVLRRMSSSWVVLLRDERDAATIMDSTPGWDRLSGRAGIPVWTDDFSNLYRVLWLSGHKDESDEDPLGR